jgi:hypothetical protein
MCIIIDVLDGDDARSIIDLFKILEREHPKGKLLGYIDKTKAKGSLDCPFLFSWGEEFYCDNQEHLKQLLDKSKKPPKCKQCSNLV